MTPADLLTFVCRSKLAVVSTTSAAGAPQAAVVGIAVTDALEIVFDTLETSRKAMNLRRDPRYHQQYKQLRDLTRRYADCAGSECPSDFYR